MTFAVTQDPTTKRYVLQYDASLHMKSNCFRYVWYRLFEGLTQEHKDYKMEYGTAFHKGLKVFYSGGTVEESLSAAQNHYINVDVPPDDFRSVGHLIVCFQQYVKYYGGSDLLRPDKVDGEFYLEKPFSYPYYRTDRVELLLSGTMDMRARYLGQRVLVDHKTTSLTQIDSYLGSYRLSPQLMMYKLIHSKLFPNEPVDCLINGIFLNRTSKNVFKRSDIICFTQQQMEAFEHHLRTRVVEVVQRFESLLNALPLDVAFPQNFTVCEEKFGNCPFMSLCLCSEDADKEMIKKTDFVPRNYNPLEFQT